MSLSKSELERLADDTYKNRIILSSTYCGRCGYNLRTLPYVYTCPECGGQYNARPLKMQGIFLPQAVQVPAGDIAAALFCVAGALLFGVNGIISANVLRVVIAGVFVLLFIPFMWRAYGGLQKLFKTRAIARQIALDEEE